MIINLFMTYCCVIERALLITLSSTMHDGLPRLHFFGQSSICLKEVIRLDPEQLKTSRQITLLTNSSKPE